MLNIFKNFASKTSILDDFQFYENRQRALSEKRARQQAQKQRELHRQVWPVIFYIRLIPHICFNASEGARVIFFWKLQLDIIRT